MMTRRAVLRIALAAAAVLVVAAMARAFWSDASAFSFEDVVWGYAAAVFACMVALVVVYAGCWWLLVRRLERRALPPGPAMRMFCMSWVGRYVPASLPHYAGRLIAGPAAGMSRPAVAASLVYENLIVLAVGAAGAALCLAAYATRSGGSWAWIVLGGGIAAVSIALAHPSVLERALDAAAHRVRRLEALRGHILPLRDVLTLCVPYAAGFICAGLAYVFALAAIGETPPPLLAIAAYNMAGIAGMLAIGVPGGLGVREAVVVALMSAVVAPADALAAAVLVRLVSIVADCVPALIAAGWALWLRARTPAPRTQPLAEGRRAA